MRKPQRGATIDGRWVLFNRSSVVPADGSMPPRKLELARSGVSLTNSWPRWAPFSGQLGGPGQTHDLHWITFSSKREFGVRQLTTTTTADAPAAAKP